MGSDFPLRGSGSAASPWSAVKEGERGSAALCRISLTPECPCEEGVFSPFHEGAARARRAHSCGQVGQWLCLLTSSPQTPLLVAEVLVAPYTSSPGVLRSVSLACAWPRLRRNWWFLQLVKTWHPTRLVVLRLGILALPLPRVAWATLLHFLFCGWGTAVTLTPQGSCAAPGHGREQPCVSAQPTSPCSCCCWGWQVASRLPSCPTRVL